MSMMDSSANDIMPARRSIEKVVSLASALADQARSEISSNNLTHYDISSAVELISEVHEAMRISEERIVDLETQLEHLAMQTKAEMKLLKERLADAEHQLEWTQQEKHQAERRAEEAEGWLGKLHEAIVETFEPMLRARAGLPPATSRSDESDYRSAQ